MNTLKTAAASTWMRLGVVGTVMVMTLGYGQVAHADTIDDAFASAQTSLLAYVALGIGVIVALLLAGIGVRLLVKYVRKAASAA